MTAQYLAGCDGGSSTVRAQLGIALQGKTLLTMRQALFRCDDLYERIPMGKGQHYHVADDKSTMMIVQDDTKHFTLHAVAGDEARCRSCSAGPSRCRSTSRPCTSAPGRSA